MHPQQPLKKQTPRRPTCFSSPSEARTPQGGGLGALSRHPYCNR